VESGILGLWNLLILPKEIPLTIGIRNPHAQRRDSESMKDSLVANDIGLI